MMARYIDAELFDKKLAMEVYLADDEDFTKAFVRGMELVKKAENEIPTADVQEVRHGHWIEKNLDGFRKVECSCSMCGWSGVENYDSYVDIHDFEFCPYRGAKMDGEE